MLADTAADGNRAPEPLDALGAAPWVPRVLYLHMRLSAGTRLTADQRRSLLERVHVLDAAPDIDETTERFQRLVLAVGHEHAKVFLERLDGWFFRRVVAPLRDPASGPVTGLEFDVVFSDRRKGFGRTARPSTTTCLRQATRTPAAEDRSTSGNRAS